jgi:hypothetical protein
VTHMNGLERVVNLGDGLDAIRPDQAAKLAL